MGLFKRHHSEPVPEAPKHEGCQPMSRRNAQPQKSHYGPHFEKGPHQEEIFDRRAAGERFPMDHPELRDRAHSFHHPRQQHQYTVPYEKMPQPWTSLMQAEHDYYHALSDGKEAKAYTKAIGKAMNTPVGRNTVPMIEHGDKIKAGIIPAVEGRKLANRAVQAREGFAQKYPQAYENHKAINYHEGQTDQRRNQARNFRLEEKKLEKKHNLWATQMRKQGRHPV